MFGQRINVVIAMGLVAATGIGASYLIIKIATVTDFSYISTSAPTTITAETNTNE